MTERAGSLLVTGASGFIGRHIVRSARRRGFEVTALGLGGNATTGADSTIQADLRDAPGLKRVFEGRDFDYVVNGAGYIEHLDYFDGGRRVIDSHLTGLMNLLDALDRSAIRGFVQIGSSDEYGGNGAPQTEAGREAPISPYSFAKAAAAHFLQMLHRTAGFPAVIVRLFLVYGPGQDRRRFLPQIIRGCLEGASFPVSAGEQLRDFCFVEDIADGIVQALTSPRAHGQVVNLASGKPVSVREMVEKVVAIIGRGAPEYGRVPYRQGENMALYADVDRRDAVLGWRPTTDLDRGLCRTIDWYRDGALQ